MRSLRRDKIHITGMAAMLMSSPGHEKLCSLARQKAPSGGRYDIGSKRKQQCSADPSCHALGGFSEGLTVP